MAAERPRRRRYFVVVNNAVDAEPVPHRTIHEAENCTGIQHALIKEISRAEAEELLSRRSPRLREPLFSLCRRCKGMK